MNRTFILKQLERYIKVSGFSAATNFGVKLHVLFAACVRVVNFLCLAAYLYYKHLPY